MIYTLFARATTVSGFRSMRGARSLTRYSCVLCEMRAEDEETVRHRAFGRMSRFSWCQNKAQSDERVCDKTRECYDSASHDKHRR